MGEVGKVGDEGGDLLDKGVSISRRGRKDSKAGNWEEV